MKRIIASITMTILMISVTVDSEIKVFQKKQFTKHNIEETIKSEIRFITYSINNSTVKDFLKEDFVYDVFINSDVKPSVVLAQAAIETGWGRKVIGNNYFGIKATDENSIRHRTIEYIDNIRTEKYEYFSTYENVSCSIQRHSNLLTSSYGIHRNSTSQEILLSLNKYATDPYYIYKVRYIIDKYDLKRFDSLKNSHSLLLDITRTL